MKDKQKNHQQHPRTTSQQLSTHFLVLTSPSPLRLYGILMSHFLQPTGNAVSCIMIWTFHIYVYTHRTWTTLEKVCIITSSAFFIHFIPSQLFMNTLKIVLRESFCLINIRELDELVNSLDFDINFEFLMCTTYTVSLSLTRSDNTSLSRPSEFLALLSAPF